MNQSKNHFLKNNKIALRNFTDSVDMHDLCKVLIVRMLRRTYKQAPIYTEYDPNKPQEDYPDVWFQIREKGVLRTYVLEIQKEITKSWTEQILEKHQESTVIIIPLKEIESRWKERIENNYLINKRIDPIRDLRIILSDYLPVNKVV